VRRSISRGLAGFSATAASIIAVVALAGPAAAATEIGWTGTTGPQAGHVYAHSSTISSDSGSVAASTDVWNAWGDTKSPPTWIGAQARLFKSGVLCKSQGFKYNTTASLSLHVETDGTDCGPGSYNSHGLVSVWGGSGYVGSVTFPTNPINFP
jgi:hypothetical protein